MLKECHYTILVILNEVKNLVPRVSGWDNAKCKKTAARGCARDQILRCAQYCTRSRVYQVVLHRSVLFS